MHQLIKFLFTLGSLLAISVLADIGSADEKNPFRTFASYAGTGYDQPYRPKFHFTSLKNWINDPNGLTYYDGEYHLFFQHNPLGTGWGNMTWGHAVSTDMVHWKQLPHAITPYGNGYVFSGTGVVDHNNSLKKQVGETKTLVLMYSYAVDIRPRFGILTRPKKTEYYQGLAYSTDRGCTFTLLNDGAPVIPFQGRGVDPKGTERDPKLFWHEPTQKWVTILWLGETSKGRVPSAAAKALKPGTNTLAIHVDNQKSLNTRQPDAEKRAGSQFIDAGIGEESIEW